MWPCEWSFPFYSQFDMRESKAMVAETNIKTGVGVTTAFMPDCK